MGWDPTNSNWNNLIYFSAELLLIKKTTYSFRKLVQEGELAIVWETGVWYIYSPTVSLRSGEGLW